MILRRLKVASFAGLVGAELDLRPGLNVILGPNEAGKSTLFQALEHILLTPVRLTKSRFQRTMEPYLPVGGGDTLEAELVFAVPDAADSTYRLRKRWGAAPEVVLELPDGNRITGEQAVQEALEELLPVDPATLRTVLLTYQSGLADTLRQLGEQPEALHRLSDLLQRSLLESDGVSTARFRELLEQRIGDLLGHWDTERGQPEGGREWNNPWKKGVGSLLQAYYDQQSLEAAYRNALEAEQSYEERNRQLESCRERLQELERAIEQESPVAADAARRDALESKREAAAAQLQAVERAYADWTESLLVRERSAEERDRLTEGRERLEVELAAVERYAASRALRERHVRAGELKGRWEAAMAALRDTSVLSAEQMEELRAVAGELQRLEGAAAGGTLSLRLEARDRLAVTAVRDLEEPQHKELAAQESLELEARGRIRLEHPDWSLEVTSGDGGFEEVARRYEQTRTRLEGLLHAAGVSSLTAAEQARSEYARLSLEADAARRAFEEALNGQAWEQLEAAAAQLPVNPPQREMEAVVSELAELTARLGRLEEGLARAGERIASLEASYGSRETLLRAVGEHAARLHELEQQLAGLRELPDGHADAASFLAQHRAREREVQGLQLQAASLESALREALRHLPEESTEELASRLSEARRQFERQARQGTALLRVRETADDILENLDVSSLEGFRRRFGDYVSELSGARYRSTPEGVLLPEALEREDGLRLGYALLSAGTQDLFSLALRLAMAEYLLAAGKASAGDEQSRPSGFMVMDDPLVDMDPERQRLAAAVMARFARGQQLVVFTCHPSHADLLAAAGQENRQPVHRVELG
ncbi:MAG: AAA family ATPase [Spirochaetales bacterium]|nr:AAA family ATPase [Spirochaetales bacterium]